jgi:16S rRNA G966 N2-methylase RsmD
MKSMRKRKMNTMRNKKIKSKNIMNYKKAIQTPSVNFNKNVVEEHNAIISKPNDFKRKFFPPHDLIENIQITTQGEYSISHLSASNLLVDLIKQYNSDMDPLQMTITDGTGNNGADTITLGMNFGNVNSIELDSLNYSVLNNNVQVYGLNNVRTIYGDTLNVLKNSKQDIIYIDAPWGGRDYKKYRNLSLYLGTMEISEIFNKFHKNAKWIIFKVPKNYDFTRFMQTTAFTLQEQHIYPFKENGRLLFYFVLNKC